MSHDFNPYREWLGVSSTGEMPSYYELLGLRPLEHDLSKIEAAYQGQAARLAAQLAGRQADVAQRLLGELAEARMTLMTPTAKRAYDAALAKPGQVAPQAPAGQSSANGNELNRAGSSATTAAPLSAPAPAPVPVSPQPAAYPAYAQPQPGGYSPTAYPAASPYGPVPAAAPVYPQAQGYAGWQGQQAVPAAVPSGPAPGYYAAPTAAYPAAQEPIATESSPAPSIRPRRTRRRSSPAPMLAGVALAAVAIVGGIWWYSHQNESVTGVASNSERTTADERQAGAHADPSPHPAEVKPETKPKDRSSTKTKQPTQSMKDHAKPKVGPVTSTGDGDVPRSDRPAKDKPIRETTPTDKSDMEKPGMDKPVPRLTAGPAGRAQDEPGKTQPDKPASDKPETEMAKEEPKPEVKASAEEQAAVGKLLKSARAALASRDISQAQDLLAEATIEATAPDTMAEVNRVELLASYVEMFWDAVRKTLPKIQLEELQIKGTMIGVVEADENHLVIRVEGKNREYTWQKLPKEIARYLADRWLAPDDPVRNLVLASFEIVDPKGDQGEAETLLEAAQAAKLNAEPLWKELQADGGK